MNNANVNTRFKNDLNLQGILARYDMLTDQREQRDFYEHQIYPLLRTRFLRDTDPQAGIELLLLTISNPHVPVFAAAYWKPHAAFVIYSDYSKRFRQRIEQDVIALGLDIVYTDAVVSNIEADPTALYQAIKTAVTPYLRSNDKHNAQIALDVTGGTSVMSVGAAMAISLVGGRLLYIPSDPQPDDPTKRQVGTERCLPFEDPYLVFGDLEAAEAKRLFAAYDYAGAQRIFVELATRVRGVAGQGYHALAVLSALYAAWDVLDFRAAAERAAELAALSLSTIAELAPYVTHLEHQRQMLEALVEVSSSVVKRDQAARETLADAESMLPLLGTLHAAALRRAAQQRYDFAALFRYRCLELISQHRLAGYGLLSNNPQFEALGAQKPEANTRFQQQQRDLGRSSARGFGKLRTIGMFDGYMILAALDDPLVRGYAIRQIEERSQARNTSVLAHGYRLIGQEEYQRFAEVVDAIVDRLFTQVLGHPRTDWEARTCFIDPFPCP